VPAVSTPNLQFENFAPRGNVLIPFTELAKKRVCLPNSSSPVETIFPPSDSLDFCHALQTRLWIAEAPGCDLTNLPLHEDFSI
jgi:hypothetical protein